MQVGKRQREEDPAAEVALLQSSVHHPADEAAGRKILQTAEEAERVWRCCGRRLLARRKLLQ